MITSPGAAWWLLSIILSRSTTPTREAGQVVLVFRIEAGHFGGFAADQGAAGLHAALRHAGDDVRDALGLVLAAGDVIQEKQGLCAARR